MIHQFETGLKLFNDFDGVAWHWYPLGAGSGDGVIPNVNDPKFLKDKIIPRLDEVELYYRSGFKALLCPYFQIESFSSWILTKFRDY